MRKVTLILQKKSYVCQGNGLMARAIAQLKVCTTKVTYVVFVLEIKIDTY